MSTTTLDTIATMNLGDATAHLDIETGVGGLVLPSPDACADLDAVWLAAVRALDAIGWEPVEADYVLGGPVQNVYADAEVLATLPDGSDVVHLCRVQAEPEVDVPDIDAGLRRVLASVGASE